MNLLMQKMYMQNKFKNLKFKQGDILNDKIIDTKR